MKAKPRAQAPAVATPGEDGIIDPASELNVKQLRTVLARVVHPKDLDRAVKRVTKVSGLRPIRPASQVCHGKSILEMLWDELDGIVERLQAGAEAEDGNDVGRAQGVAYAIAVIENPYHVDMERIRAEAMDRWEAQNEEEEE